MSGSGDGGGGFYSPPESCADLAFETQLSSPKSDVVAHIQLHDVLDLETQEISGTSVVVALHQGKVAGGLASPLVTRLRECIARGTQYIATVTSKDEGQVRVRVKAV